MNELEEVFWEAWKRVWPRVRENPEELLVRLARRRSRMYRRPMRAFCVAVRASDHRMNPGRILMWPEDAAYPGCPEFYAEHSVLLEKPMLVELCRPVSVVLPGELVEEVAARLGCHGSALMPLRRNGTLDVVFKRGLCGRKGEIPLLRRRELLDPQAFGKERPDPIWGGLWTMHAEALPEGFQQTVKRTPEWRIVHGRKRHFGWRWLCPGCGRRVRTIYYPIKVPDWGEYLRDRGRISALEARLLGLRPAKELIRIVVRGNKEELAAIRDGTGQPNEVEAVPEPNECFACSRCHGVLGFGRASLTRSWNQLVLHSSGGLLYGKEVRRPAWLVKGRKKAFAHRWKEAKRRKELLRLLVATEMSMGEIAMEMGIKYDSVRTEACRLRRAHGVKDREGLRKARWDLLERGRRAG